MPYLSLAEQLAQQRKIVHLADIGTQSDWDRRIVQQAVLAVGTARDTFSCNDLRDLLPEQGHGFLGRAISGLRNAKIIAHADDRVPSTLDSTKGHGIEQWRLTAKGRALAAARRRDEPAGAAA